MAKVIIDKKKIDELLKRGVEDVIVRENIEKKLKSGKRLKIKLGIDPSGDALHIGHAVILRKLRALQDMGHEIILIVGSFTGTIGDPTGKTTTRKQLTESDVKKNFQNYKAQASRVLNMRNTKVLYNHKWLKKLKLSDVLEIAGSFTVSQMLERDMYQERMKKGLSISMPEFFYPLMQGYDSVMVDADIELGGTDQLFNVLAGRVIQKHFGKKEQDVMVTPLLVGLDGVKKMSKSENNYIAIEDAPNEMYGKVMSIPDTVMENYYELATDIDVESVKKEIKENPRDAKMKLASEIVTIYHSKEDAKKAEDEFIKTFQKKGTPDDIKEITINSSVENVEALALSFGVSKSEIRRLIKQKGIKMNGKVIEEETKLEDGAVMQKGKRHFVKVIKK